MANRGFTKKVINMYANQTPLHYADVAIPTTSLFAMALIRK
jgi:hypothetical protein